MWVKRYLLFIVVLNRYVRRCILFYPTRNVCTKLLQLFVCQVFRIDNCARARVSRIRVGIIIGKPSNIIRSYARYYFHCNRCYTRALRCFLFFFFLQFFIFYLFFFPPQSRVCPRRRGRPTIPSCVIRRWARIRANCTSRPPPPPPLAPSHHLFPRETEFGVVSETEEKMTRSTAIDRQRGVTRGVSLTNLSLNNDRLHADRGYV